MIAFALCQTRVVQIKNERLSHVAFNRTFQLWLAGLYSHFIDTVGSLKCSLLNLINFVSAHVQNFKIGQSVEEPQGGYLCDAVVSEDEVGGGGGDVSRDVLQTCVGAVHFTSVTSNQEISELSPIPVTATVNQLFVLPAARGTQGILLAAMSGSSVTYK